MNQTDYKPNDRGRRLHLMSSLRLLRPYESTNTPNSGEKVIVYNFVNKVLLTCADSFLASSPGIRKGQEVSPWKQSRNSSFCGALVTWMMEMGKLWEDAANTAEARVTSFFSRNSGSRWETKPMNITITKELWVCFVWSLFSFSFFVLRHDCISFWRIDLSVYFYNLY